MVNEQLGTSDDVARRFGVSTATVNRWVRIGAIPCLRPSRRVVRFDMKAVDRALADRASGVYQNEAERCG